MNLQKAIQHAIDGEAALFLGAGFSIGGKNKYNKAIPTAAGLSKILCDDMGIAHNDDLSLVSGRYIGDKVKGKGLANLINLLVDHLTCTETDETQDVILGLKWNRIYTTNYDDLIEVSSEKQGKKRRSITATMAKFSEDVASAILHINGFIRNINFDTFYEEFKITDESYLRNGFLDTKWRTQFESDLRNSQAIVFVGYSLQYDLDLQKVLYSANVRDKCIFINKADLDENNEFKLSTFGSVEKIGVKGFSDNIKQIKLKYIPKTIIEDLKGTSRITLNSYVDRPFGSKEVLNLLDKGDYERSLFRSVNQYHVRRNGIFNVINTIIEKHKICILNSHFGNGKTLTLEHLASEFVENNNVFYLNDNRYVQDDLRIICKDDSQRNILLIDDYGMYLQVFKELVGEFPENLRIIATSRTSINDNLIYELTEKIGFEVTEIYSLNIDAIDTTDRTQLIKLLDKYNFWGKYSKSSPQEKRKLIEKRYHNRLSSVFYMLLESGVIEDKIKTITETALKNETIKKFVIAQSINIICNFKLSFHQLVSLSNIDILVLKNSCHNNSVKEIYDIDNETIRFKSGVLAQYIVKKGEFNELIKDTLIDLYLNAEKQDYKGVYFNLKKLIISRSNIKEVFTSRNDNNLNIEKKIAAFYDAIMNESQVENNPFFWLQYAITVLNLKDYPRAKIYFDNAYAHVKSLEVFDCFQLDTHHARFLLQYKIEVDKVKETAYDDFVVAHKKLMTNSNYSTKLSYVLRQISLYYSYYREFYDSFTPAEQLKFIDCLRQVTVKFYEYFTSIQSKIDYYVKIAYIEYRKIFIEKDIASELKELDILYNSKLHPRDRMRVKYEK